MIIVSGYFNPLHKGHIEYFEKAKELGDELLVIVNNDLQRKLKGSIEFQDEAERLKIVSSLRLVDHVMLSIDKDRSVKETISAVAQAYQATYNLVFANGGDQFFMNSPEKLLCERLNINMVDGLGSKIQSSSHLLRPKDE